MDGEFVDLEKRSIIDGAVYTIDVKGDANAEHAYGMMNRRLTYQCRLVKGNSD